MTKLNLGGLQGECNFLTEDGLYEVLMQSRKPIAKQFKKEVKAILKQMRLTGGAVVKGKEVETMKSLGLDTDVNFYVSEYKDKSGKKNKTY